MKAINPFRSRSLALSLLALGMSASPLTAANIIVNGDFSSNASSFISFPGYRGSGSNPQIANWSFTAISGGNAGINGPSTGVGEPFAPSTTVDISNFDYSAGRCAPLQRVAPPPVKCSAYKKPTIS